MWRAIHHPNVLPLLGVTTTEDQLVMVSKWMPRGNIVEFTKAYPDVDRLGLVRLHPGPLSHLLLMTCVMV